MENNKRTKFKSTTEFGLYIEKQVTDHKITHLEAVLQFCEERGIDPEEVASSVGKPLKEKLEANFRDLNYLPKPTQLDL